MLPNAARGRGQAGCPMPLGFELVHPGGMVENSPAFQRWVCMAGRISPEGTTEAAGLNRPFGTQRCIATVPALKRLAIVVCPSGMKVVPRLPDAGHPPNPGALGRNACPTLRQSLPRW